MVICLKAAVYLAEDATDKKTDTDVNVEVTTTDAAPSNGNDKAVRGCDFGPRRQASEVTEQR